MVMAGFRPEAQLHLNVIYAHAYYRNRQNIKFPQLAYKA